MDVVPNVMTWATLVVREESQIKFVMGNIFCKFGEWGAAGVGILHKNVSQILAIIDFSSGQIVAITLSIRENIIGNIKEVASKFLWPMEPPV